MVSPAEQNPGRGADGLLGVGDPIRNRRRLLEAADPVHFRYAWGRNPIGNACIPSVPKRHIALGTQRSDDWAYWEVPNLDLPAHERTTRQGLDKIREALRLIDLERRVLGAKHVLERDGERYEESAK